MNDSQAHSGPVAGSRRFSIGVAAVLLLALAVRALHLWQIRSAPLFGLKIGDSLVYDTWARQILSGNVPGEVYWYAPLYPYFLSGIYKFLGDGLLWPLAVQAVIGAASCVLLADAGRRLISPRAGILAGTILAVYAPAVFYDGILHKPVLVLFFLCLVLWLWAARLRDPGTAWSWLWLGVALGGLVLARQNILAFFPILLLWLVLDRRLAPRRRAMLSLAFVVGLALPLFPVALRNKIVGGELHLTAANFGDNFYKGNNEDADGTYMALPGGRPDPRYERADATEIAEREMGRKLTPSEISSYWTRRSLEYIAERPGHWLRLMAVKLALTWNAVELGDVEDPYTYAEWSLPLRMTMPVMHFGLIAPLAVLGLFATWSRRSALWPLYLMIVGYTATVVMFYVFGRYRYPLVPLTALLAAAGIAEGLRYLRTSSRRQVAICSAAVLAMLVLANWPTAFKADVLLTTRQNVGATLHEQGRLAEAIEFYALALEITPQSFPLRARFAEAMVAQAEREEEPAREELLEEGIAHYRHALMLNPADPRVHRGLAHALRIHGQRRAALESLGRAYALTPEEERTGFVRDVAAGLLADPDVRPFELDYALAMVERRIDSGAAPDPELLELRSALRAAAEPSS